MRTSGSHVLVLSKAYPPVAGGVETYSEAVARAYAELGFGVTVLSQVPGPAGWRDPVEGGPPVRLFNTGGGGQIITAMKMWWRLRAWGRRHFQLVHATTWRPATVLNWGSAPPTIVTVHGREVLINPKIVEPLMKRVLRNARVVVTVSTATQRRALAKIGPNRNVWVTAPNGLTFAAAAVASQLRAPSHRLRILSFSRLVSRKNLRACIDACARLRDEGLEFDYDIAGKGPLLKELEAQVTELRLEGTVRFLGYIDESAVPSMYRSADIFLHPQIEELDGREFEGFGLVIADAMSFGCAVVAGENGGPIDFVRHRKNGLLVSGSVDSIAEAIRELLRDRDLLVHLQAEARSVVDVLSWTAHVEAGIAALQLDKEVP
jgi:phosphatidylinositol alpha-1,6-mannosyltransferase